MPAAGEISWVLETPGSAAASAHSRSLYNETGARKRRQHQKSRKGCIQCKQRRVKCDEVRPTCGHCVERKWECEFPTTATRRKGPALSPVSSVSEKHPSGSQSPTPDPTGLEVGSRVWKHTQLLSCLEKLNVPRQAPGDHSAYQRQDALELMDHFEDTLEPWLGSPVAQSMIQEHGIQIGLKAPYLLHALLAYSASHLSRLHPEQPKYSEAAKTHFTRSLQAYSTELVYELERGNANALLSASGILAKLSFINTPVLSNEKMSAPPVPAWIRSMQGVRTIMSTPTLRKQLEEGLLGEVVRYYTGSALVPVTLCRSDDGQVLHTALIHALRSLCLRPATTTHSPAAVVGGSSLPLNTYTAVLDRLERLMLCELKNETVDPMLAFIATLEPSFLELLEQHDERASLILAFWCTRIGVIGQWWTGPSARAECRRICERLADSKDPGVRDLLAYPARFCGFSLEGQKREKDLEESSDHYWSRCREPPLPNILNRALIATGSGDEETAIRPSFSRGLSQVRFSIYLAAMAARFSYHILLTARLPCGNSYFLPHCPRSTPLTLFANASPSSLAFRRLASASFKVSRIRGRGEGPHYEVKRFPTYLTQDPEVPDKAEQMEVRNSEDALGLIERDAVRAGFELGLEVAGLLGLADDVAVLDGEGGHEERTRPSSLSSSSSWTSITAGSAEGSMMSARTISTAAFEAWSRNYCRTCRSRSTWTGVGISPGTVKRSRPRVMRGSMSRHGACRLRFLPPGRGVVPGSLCSCWQARSGRWSHPSAPRLARWRWCPMEVQAERYKRLPRMEHVVDGWVRQRLLTTLALQRSAEGTGGAAADPA
ncbi:hypothetical protein KC320_g222 [Hortaea werneckii]|nr:hypothetical protein KC320_g222 [Hortaea werneckii]